ncbi:DUF885 domain-containing protein [Longimicrobium terrae]|uniref:Uncharacterized protein (DUF885 family) n=1 Tax=Longimicrobium terrae TaxID=1639882 RepID=A0A841GVT9_9BACT|nr:DUF885 domain-containing protein [Longimicrobium terrae]MBB4634065.1 uncharacterized protein (DUF885 family) [Longimicrobium terrae]MBB6069045.1 uncharacterized protein (DUF885 family) [Longimicrobium terrae]NNC28222.1 DUF885 domain-containing protein [Longimicrobium terrae]
MLNDLTARGLLTRREMLAALAAAALPLVSACGAAIAPVSSAAGGADGDAVALLDRIGNDLLNLFPESATSLGLDTGARAGLRAQLTDRSPAGEERIARQLRADLAALAAVDGSRLSHPVRTSVEVVRSAYTTALEGFALPYGDITVGGWRNTPYTVIQNVGAYLDVPRFLDSDHRVENAVDAEAYLARMQSYARELDGELERVRAARGIGLVPPAFLLDKALGQMRLSAQNAREGGTLVESLERRTRNIAGDWAGRARRIAAGEIAPALDRQIRELEAQRAVATNDAGISARPHGEEFYRWALKASTTTSMSPDEVHELGRSELARLQAQMDVILKQAGYTQGTVGERMNALARDPRYKFAEGDAGRAEIRAFIDDRLAWIRAQMPRAFNTVVDPHMEVKRLPPEEEPGAPAAYGGAGSVDGAIPGRFWINLRTTDLHSRYSLADLTFHESIPGHIWQGEYTHGMPLVRQMLAFNAYSEGWALYAEQLADELGAYESDPIGRLGYLQSIAFRACRLVVDTGLHAKGWTREQGVRFFVDVNGSNPLEVASEVDRYCSWPGQACGYKVGHSEINRQRDRARAALGARYDLKAFNDTVVRGGNVPLDVLARNVDEYLRR